ncbi:MAG TPA: M1 family metallopeptidase [Vicinamibacterales bacterium]|nr:M1 family metallopeptidase [Vicinamibacterales bacterium]
MRTRVLVTVALVVAVGLWWASLTPTAERLPIGVRPSHYDLAFDVDLIRARFTGTETIQVQISEPTSRIVLNAAELELTEATIVSSAGEQKATVALDGNAQTATLTVPRRLPDGAARIVTRFAGTLNNDLRGFYLSQANGRNYAITQFESTDARRAFPSFDEPALKATFALKVTVNQGDTVISNGPVVSDAPGPGNNRHTLTFGTSPKMSTYLVAMAVGDFQCLEAAADDIPIRVCATPRKKEMGQIALGWAKDILSFYNRYYDIKYPFKKLDLVAVPDFAAGAMENTASIFFREQDLLAETASASVASQKNIASVIAHEVAHQWFGDLVTMKWWDDLWLNEGFATWMENRPLAVLKPEWNMAVDESDETRSALALDTLRTTRPIHSNVETPAQIEESFDGIAYEKGAAVLRMIERYVGEEPFRRAINVYIDTYQYGNATSENFWTTVARVTGTPVDRILPTFVNQAGAPLVEVSLACRNGGTELSLAQRRFVLDTANPAAADGEKWEIPLCFKTPQTSSNGCSVLSTTTATMPIGASCQPWAFVNADAKGYFRTAYSPGILKAMAPALQTYLTAPERSSLVDDSWAMVTTNRLNIADYLSLASGFGQETNAGVLSQVVTRFEFIRNYLTTTDTRGQFAAWVRTLLRPRFDELGTAVQPGDSDNRRELRSVVIRSLGTVGDDRDVETAARAALDRALASPDPSRQLDPSTASDIVRVAARHGDRALFDGLMKAAAAAQAPDERQRYLYGLTMFEDDGLFQRALDFTLSPDLRRQDAALYMSRLLSNPVQHQRAWEFLKARWPELQPKFSIAFGEVRVMESLSSFCSTEELADVKSFLSTHRVAAARRTVDQTFERIASCAALRERQTPVLARQLAAR